MAGEASAVLRRGADTLSMEAQPDSQSDSDAFAQPVDAKGMDGGKTAQRLYRAAAALLLLAAAAAALLHQSSGPGLVALAPQPIEHTLGLSADYSFLTDDGEPLTAGDPELETDELKEAMRQTEEEARAETSGETAGAEVKAAKKPAKFTLVGKSMYFLMTDRFARSGTGPTGAQNTTFCGLDSDGEGGWCDGTFQGIIRKLPYIKGMGFDCIWISPVIDAMDYTGYFGRNFYRINKHWGSQRDLKLLSYYLHKLNMCLCVDIVTNHVRQLVYQGKPVPHGNAVPVVPFNKGSYFHQLNKKPGTNFEQYVKQPPPYASNGQGNTTVLKEGVEAGRFTCGPNVPDITYCTCFPGNSGEKCPGWNFTLQREGWFGSLGDLNMSKVAVRSGLLRFAVGLKRAFGVDAIRLDTAIYQSRGFLAELQTKVGIEILGEATVNNLTYAGTFQRFKGERVLKGLLNFPPFYWIPRAFCSYYLLAPFAQYQKYQGTWMSEPPNLTQVSAVINAQQTGGMYDNLDLLGNFADNHDEFSRISWYCKEDSQRIKNILALVFFMRGLPILYYGTEQGLLGHQLTKTESKDYTIPTGQFRIRESLWQTLYSTSTWQYKFIAQLNSVRKRYKFAAGEMEILNMSRTRLVFTRTRAEKTAKSEAWVFINNFDNSTDRRLKYCPGPKPVKGKTWIDALTDEPADLRDGCYMAGDRSPKVLVQKRG